MKINDKIIKNIIIRTNLITNFKPVIFDFQNKLKKQNTKYDNNRIYCKNFFLYLLLIKYKNFHFFKKSSLFFKKQKKQVYTILRAPYRHKLTRHQLTFSRYNINSSIFVKLKNPVNFKNWSNILNFINFIKSFNKIYESNIIYINSIKINIPILYKFFSFK